jgi:hypothetical protein
MARKTRKTAVRVGVTGRSVAYVQEVGKGGKLGKAKPVVITTVRVGAAGQVKKRGKRR